MKIFRLKFILKKIFGDKYKNIRNLGIKYFNPFIFNFTKKIGSQSIVKKEKGFIIDSTIDNYSTFHLRPKKSENFDLLSTEIISKKVAIIIQGNIGENYYFLKETLGIYKKIFPNIMIIISTWKNENQSKILKLESKNIKVLFNDEPNTSSPGNSDFQLISTFNGLTFAKQNGIEFCLKQRSDLRVNKNNIMSFLISLIENYPIKSNSYIKGRIITTSLNTLKYRLFSLSDFLLFGFVDDLLIYFENLNYEKSLKINNFGEAPCFIEETPVEAEILFCARYIKKINGEIKWDLDFWWKSLKDYFCVVDSNSLDIFWKKYDLKFEHRYYRNYSKKISRGIEFSDWLSLYNEMEINWKKHFNDHERYDKNYSIKNFKF
tara:strand:+ start:1888 stop:3015 length:1128 start_codon:yes stop_codon:yes gene_type:complete